MKRDDVIAGVVGGTIIVIGCTVGIFGYQKLHEPLFMENPPKTAIRSEPHEDRFSIGDEYDYQVEEDDTISVPGYEDADNDLLQEEDPDPVRLTPEDYDIIWENSDNYINAPEDPGLDVTDTEYYFDKYDNAEQQNTPDHYVLNTGTLKIHHPSCNDVRKISPENYATSNGTIEELLSQGYTRCGHCFQ
ncbi:MAG: hypothetical protein K6G58_06325 [Lachnospiraceae bacterium]|nr:hypothetical protein [Lachnospiraceae bacterium]